MAATTADAGPAAAAATSAVAAPGPPADAARLLPAGAMLYVEIDADAALPPGSRAREMLLAAIPAECVALLGLLRGATVAAYMDPDGFAAVVSGPTTASLRGCLEGGAQADAAAATEERAGMLVFRYGGGFDGALFVVSESTHVLASTSLVDAVASAAAGGATLAGSDLLRLRSEAPGGAVTGVLRIPEAVRSREAPVRLARTLGVGNASLPEAVVFSAQGAAPGDVTAVALAGDPAAAAALADALRREIDDARSRLAGPAADPWPVMPREDLGKLLEGISLAVDGGRVRIRLPGDSLPGGAGAVGALATAAFGAYGRHVQRSTTGEARVNLAKMTALLEHAAAADGPPRNERVARPCPEPNCNAECVPRDFADVAGKAFLPAEGLWSCSGGGTTCTPDTAWSRMRFALTQPIRYQYCYAVWEEGGEVRLELAAFGDLDGDGVPSSFHRTGRMIDGAPVFGELVVRFEDE